MSLRTALRNILETYVQARELQAFPGDMASRFDALVAAVETLPCVAAHPELEVRAGFGKGNWARSPWIVILDPRETRTPRQGVFVNFKFPMDMSGVCLTLNQGHDRDRTELGTKRARELWRDRADAIRAEAVTLAEAGFRLDGDIDLGLDYRPAIQDMAASTIAWQRYPEQDLPDDEALDRDVGALLAVYRRVAGRAVRPTPTLDPEALDVMRRRFLALMTGFETFSEAGLFETEERGYKAEMAEVFQAELLPALSAPITDHADAVPRVEALRDFLTRRKFGVVSPMIQNLVSWRITEHLGLLTPEEVDRAAALYGDLLAGPGESPDRVERFTDGYAPILRAHMRGSPNGATRSLPTLLLMLADPEHDIVIRTSLFNDAAHRLTGGRLFGDVPLDAADYRACLAVATALRDTLADWGWGPRDLIDVQGFLWVGLYDGYAKAAGVPDPIAEAPSRTEDDTALREAAVPGSERRIFKIAPGEQSRFWADCRQGGFMCVGWDEIGDLRDFPADFADEEFVSIFREAHPEMYQGSPGKLAVGTRKARELWQLRDIQPGDIILANRGVSRLLAAGEVVEPGYSFDDTRPEYKHVVAVRWDESVARDLAGTLTPGERAIWMNSTLAPVDRALFRRLLGFAQPEDEAEGEGDEGIASDGTDAYSEPDLDTITTYIAKVGLHLSDRTVRRYHAAVRSRGFVILAGVSGTGKTWLAESYAKTIGARLAVVRVAPNWNSNEDLLGWTSPLTGDYQDTPVSAFLREAAVAWRDGDRRPFHVLLDEMNLARVEHYFADFLSALEQRNRTGTATLTLGADVVTLYRNLVFVGTVNMDETTHGFAQKVYDRAQLVEIDLDADAFARSVADVPWGADLVALREAVEDAAPIAFRTAHDVASYVEEARAHGASWEEAFDEAVLQKVLPRIGGMDLAVGEALDRIVDLCAGRYPLSAAKAGLMRERFRGGVASFF